MNTSFNDLKEIFSTPPTEARYSWIIHSGNQTLEASAVRMQPPTTETAAGNSQQPPPRPPRVARTNSLNPFTPPDEVQTNSETAQMSQSQEVANKRIKTDEPEELLLDMVDQQCTDQNQQNVSPSQRSPIRPSSISPRQFLRNHARGRDQGDFTDNKENNMQQPQSSTPDSLDDYSTTRGGLGDKFNIQSKYLTKRPQSRQPCTNQNGSAALTGYQLKNMRLQEEVNSANKKIHRLNHINQNAMKRKSELQKEVLDAYKKISELEVTRHTWSEKQRELALELKTSKQRIGDAEREAAHAIGCQSKLQRELIETESKKQKYFEGLDHAERRISKLEELMKELELESRQESLMKSDLEKRLYESEANLKLVSSDNTNLINKLGIKEKEHSIIEKRLEREIAEKEQIESKTSELVKENNHLNKELNRLESKYEMAERTIGQYSTKLSAEKEKYQLASTLKTESERELRDTKQTLMKERAQKELLNTECQVTIEKYRNLKRNYEKTSKQNELLRRENRDLKDRVLYFELYQKISDKKARPENGGTSSDKKRTTFLDTLNELKVSKEKAQIQRSRNGSRDSWDIEDGEQGAWDQSQRVQRAWGEGHGRSSKHGSNNSLDRLSEMSAQIEKLQKEQKVLNHVTAESCNGSSKAPSRINTARKSISPRSEHLVYPTRSPPKSPNKHSASLDVPNPNDTIMSFNDDEEEGDIQVGNLATFSDLLNNNTNKDIANALL